MSAVLTRPLPDLPYSPKAPWLRFLEGDGTDGTPGSTPGTGTPADPPKADPPKPGEPPAQEDKTDWKAKARMWEARAKENNKAAEDLQKIKDAEKTELQKAIDRAEKAERKAQELEAVQTRRELAEEVSKEKRVPVQLLMRSNANTEEEMKAYADDLLAAFKPEKQGVVPKSGTDGGDKDKATSLVAAGRERFEARHKKSTS